MAELTQAAANQLQALFDRVAILERTVGSPVLQSGRVNQAQQTFLGKPKADIEEGESGDFTLWTRGDSDKGSEAATSITLENVYMRSGDADTDDLCYILYCDGGLEASRAVC